MRCYKIRISGRVHGVNFRWSTKQKAKGLGINGYVRNQEHRLVYIEAEGQEDCLEEFLAWCHRGPFFARVEKVEFEETDIAGYNTFEIKF